jgi:hypothetical protein
VFHCSANPLGDPAALPGREQEFDVFGNLLQSLFIGFEKDVHVLVHVVVDGFWRM